MLFPATIIIADSDTDLSPELQPLLDSVSNNLSPNNPDIFTINRQTGWGIETIRSLKNFLSQKPVNHPSQVVLIYEAHELTPESQNALLKTLEEPPKNSYIILITSSISALLPTITSRSHLLRLQTSSPKKTQDKPLDFSLPLAEKLILAEKLAATKDQVLPFLQNQVRLYQQQLIAQPKLTPPSTLKKLLRALAMLHANVDPRATLDYLLLS
jgi:DNA polymerase III delta prime subunit